MAQITKQDMIDWLNHGRKVHQNELNQWAERFAKDPADALRWSENTFRSAAEVETLTWTIAMLERYDTPEEVIEELRNEVLRAARRQDFSSTSLPANAMSEARRVAQAKILEQLDRRL